MRWKPLYLCLLLAPVTLQAHHSFAGYDRSVVRDMEGDVVDVHWRNPHVTFTVRAEDSDGEIRDWVLETSAPYVLQRSGLTSNMFSVGQRVRIAAWPSMQQPKSMLYVTNMLLPSGKEVLFLPKAPPRWSTDTTGSEWLSEPVSDEKEGIFRIWSVANFDAYLEAAGGIDFRLTPEAQALVPESPQFDPCKPQGMPGLMLSPLPFELIDRGDHIDLQMTDFGVLRRIDMTASPNTETIPSTDLGYSTGRLVNGSLQVRTTRVGWPYLDDTGRPQTENVEILEQFSLLDDGVRLRYTQTIRDPGSLIVPTTVSWDMVDIGETKIEPLRCEEP